MEKKLWGKKLWGKKLLISIFIIEGLLFSPFLKADPLVKFGPEWEIINLAQQVSKDRAVVMLRWIKEHQEEIDEYYVKNGIQDESRISSVWRDEQLLQKFVKDLKVPREIYLKSRDGALVQYFIEGRPTDADEKAGHVLCAALYEKSRKLTSRRPKNRGGRFLTQKQTEEYFKLATGVEPALNLCGIQFDASALALPVEVQKELKTYGGKFVLGISLDGDTVEIQGTPLSAAGYKALEGHINQALFEVARNLNFKLASDGAAHVHIGLNQAFPDGKGGVDTQLVQKFMRDFVNHEPCFRGLYDDNNAEYVGHKTVQEVEAVRQVLDEETGSYKDYDGFRSAWQGLWGNAKYQSMRLSVDHPQSKVDLNGTIELRCFPARFDAKEYAALYELLTARINALRSRNLVIEVKGVSEIRKTPTEKLSHDSCAHYVKGAGLKWEHYRDLLTQDPRKPG